MTVEAHAKINLTLEVLGTRPDGYHELRSVVAPIPMHDDVAFSAAEGDSVSVEGCDGVPPEKNLARRAALLLREASGCRKGVRIAIVKRIPMGAGLGGGSADAAAVLTGLDRFWNLGFPVERLMALGAEIGSDVPALVHGGVVLMEGRGEKVSPCAGFPTPPWEKLVVYTPPVFSSTARVYGEFRETDRGAGKNDLQPAACRLYPGIRDALRKLEAEGCRDVMMSGSGSTVFGWRE